MPHERAFRCPKCSRTFKLEESLNEHNLQGIHDPMKPRGGHRENSGGPRENSGGPRKNAGGPRKNAGGRRGNSGPTEDYTDEVIQPIKTIETQLRLSISTSVFYFYLMVGTRVHRTHEGEM